jgi:hypothetical protein
MQGIDMLTVRAVIVLNPSAVRQARASVVMRSLRVGVPRYSFDRLFGELHYVGSEYAYELADDRHASSPRRTQSRVICSGRGATSPSIEVRPGIPHT